MSLTKDTLITKLSDPVEHSSDKVTVVGCGMVGCASVHTIVAAVSKLINIPVSYYKFSFL